MRYWLRDYYENGCGLLISHKNGEKRRALFPEDIKKFRDTKGLPSEY